MATSNKRIDQFNTDTNLTGSELVLMMDNGITKNMGLTSVKNFVLSGVTNLSDLGFNITPKPSKVINQNIILPDNTKVTYPSPLIMGINNTIVVPTNTILTII